MNAVGVISFAYYYIELIAPNTDTSRVLIDLFASRGARPHPLHRSHTDLVDQTEKKGERARFIQSNTRQNKLFLRQNPRNDVEIIHWP